MDALAGKYRCLLIEGRSVIERTGAEGELLLAGQGARVAPEALESGQALVGRRALVGRGTALAGGVVIGSGSVVGAGTRLENVVVWPGTGVGDQLAVSRGILAGDLLIRLTDRGAEVTRITDPFLLTDLSLASPVAWFAGLRDRCAAILLLLLTAPLWVLLIAGGVRQRTVLGNRRTPEGAARPLRLWEGRRGPAWLRMIPGLPAVAAGHLRLTGVCPLTPEEDAARTTSWEHARDGRPVGLWGAAQVALVGGPVRRMTPIRLAPALPSGGLEAVPPIPRQALSVACQRISSQALMSPLVEESWLSTARPACNSGKIPLASCLPSSTPHWS
jgi:hypothetical protein